MLHGGGVIHFPDKFCLYNKTRPIIRRQHQCLSHLVVYISGASMFPLGCDRRACEYLVLAAASALLRVVVTNMVMLPVKNHVLFVRQLRGIYQTPLSC